MASGVIARGQGPVGSAALRAAYRHCEAVTRRSGSSFASAFWMLPAEKRRALHAIYAFCRLADDIADDPELRADRGLLLERWRGELERAYLGKSLHPVGIALGDAVHRFCLPERLFAELLQGVEFDLRGERPQSFEDLRRYCHRVASTVGLLLVRVMGYQNPRSLDYAEAMGIAVQLTNVLRDVGADAAAGRVYLPGDDLAHFGVRCEDLRREERSEGLRLVLALTAERAHLYYERARGLLPDEDRRRLRAAEAMGRIYEALLEELSRQGFPLQGDPPRLSRARRLAIAASVWLGAGVAGAVGRP